MKKFLLLAAAGLVAGTSFAEVVVDPATYEEVDGMCLKNRVLQCETTIGKEAYGKMPWMNSPNYARTACLAKYNGKDVILISNSKDVEADAVVDKTVIYVVDLASGEFITSIKPTLNGERLSGLLAANSIGCDDFGHVWIMGYRQTQWVTPKEDEGGEPYAAENPLYQLNLETGELTVIAKLKIDEGDASNTGRVDYWDIVGDITREQARCVVCTVPNEVTSILGWVSEQGSEEWIGLFDEYYSVACSATFPVEQTAWGTGPVVKIVKSAPDDFSASLFYTDGNTTRPTLYSATGDLQDSFEAVSSELWPSVAPNGIVDITLNGKNYAAYVLSQYQDKNHAGGITNVVSLDETLAFESMQKMWSFPEAGMGENSDGGNRVHCLNTKIYTDDNNVEGAYILSYKCANGFGVYTFAPKDWADPNGDPQGGVNDIVADDANDAPVEYFNLNGVKVSGDLTPGLYITRQGNKVAKQIVK